MNSPFLVIQLPFNFLKSRSRPPPPSRNPTEQREGRIQNRTPPRTGFVVGNSNLPMVLKFGRAILSALSFKY